MVVNPVFGYLMTNTYYDADGFHNHLPFSLGASFYDKPGPHGPATP